MLWIEDVRDALKRLYGETEFRANQEDAIRSACEGRDTLIIMATGAGKSLCFTLPPVLLGVRCLVVCPLISLMQDQVASLRSKGLKACAMSGCVSNAEDTTSSSAQFVFVTPEYLAFARQHDVSLGTFHFLVVDECHCISEWGHDFRPDYSKIASSIDEKLVTIAATATATEHVVHDVVACLRMDKCNIIRGNVDRPNITYSVLTKKRGDGFAQLIERCEVTPGSIVVYAQTVKEVEAIHTTLLQRGQKSVAYHASRSPEEKTLALSQFQNDGMRIVVATIAFGMGIDKKNVRAVFHWGPSKSVEAYYQESGRAGRDGEDAEAVLWTGRSDWVVMGKITNKHPVSFVWTESPYPTSETIRGERLSSLLMNKGRVTSVDDLLAIGVREVREGDSVRCGEKTFVAKKLPDPFERANGMKRYVLTRSCRRSTILAHFGDKKKTPLCRCDNCSAHCNAPMCDEDDMEVLLNAIKESNSRFGMGTILSALVGKKQKTDLSRCSMWSTGRFKTEKEWKVVAHECYTRNLVTDSVKRSSSGFTYVVPVLVECVQC